MVFRYEKIKLVSNNYEELMSEVTKEILDKNNNGWRIDFIQHYSNMDGYAVVLEAERRFQFDENAV